MDRPPDLASDADDGNLRAVLWDFGGVLTTSPFDAFLAYERANSLPSGFIRGLNATNSDTNAWARFERNELDVDDFAASFEAEAAAAGGRVDARELLAVLRTGELRPAMLDAVRRCHERLRTGLLTNNFAPATDGGVRHGLRPRVRTLRSRGRILEGRVPQARSPLLPIGLRATADRAV